MSVPFIALWFDYVTSVRNNVGDWPGLFYSLPDYPLLMIPILAWLPATDEASTTERAHRG